MKKSMALLLVGAMVLSLAGCTGSQSSSTGTAGGNTEGTTTVGAEAGDVIKLGYFGPETGPNSMTGQEARKGAQLKVKEINQAGGILGQQVTLVVYDDKGTPEGAVKAATRLVEDDKVSAIVGSQLSSNLQAAGDKIEKGGIPCVGTGLGPVWLKNGWKYFFRSQGNSESGAAPLNDVMEQVGVKSMAVMIAQDEGSISSAKLGTDEVGRRGNISITTSEVSQNTDTDWTGQLSKMISTSPDGIFLSVQVEQAGPMIKQLRGLGYEGFIFGNECLGMPDVRLVAGDAANNSIYYAVHVIPDSIEEANSEKEKAFLQAFTDEYGALPIGDVAYRTYDAVTIIQKGIEDAGNTEPTAIRDAIKNISGLEVLAGTIDYTQFDNGEGMVGTQIFITENGRNYLFEKYVDEFGVPTVN